MGLHRVNDIVHHLGGLPHRQAADGVAVAVQLGNLVHMPDAKVRKRGPLVDAEEELPGVDSPRQSVQPVVLPLAALQPAECALAGGFGIIVGRGVFHALVKGHGNIAAQVGLDAHGLLRSHENLSPVDVRGEIDSLLFDPPEGGQRKDLEAAGIRQNGAVPVHELMEPPHLPHQLVAGTEVKMVGIAQLNLAADLPEVKGVHASLDSGLRAHVHKDRRLDHAAVGAGKLSAPGAALCLQQFEHLSLLFY